MAAPVATSTLTHPRGSRRPPSAREVSALFTSIWGGHQHIPPELGRAIVGSGRLRRRARDDGRRGRRRVGRRGRAGERPDAPPLAHHRSRPGEQRTRRRPRAQAPPTGMGARARHGPRRLDVRPARAPQRAGSTSPASARSAVRYEVDFYGPVRDAINGDDETDRLVVEWPTDGDEGPGADHRDGRRRRGRDAARTSSRSERPNPQRCVRLVARRAPRSTRRARLAERLARSWRDAPRAATCCGAAGR